MGKDKSKTELAQDPAEHMRAKCRVFGEFLEDDKDLCGKCETKLRDACIGFKSKQ